ncbi:putative ABC transport system permease protein [Mariprofundus micogutta]|uniref:Putative ABC transport system permease protein n=1 Tax=Mariprofundus micogutta TaxID=1921010 RepID=A0A1L8CQH5_9PROT|nr:FtsX-like permease family protein [Mariprofundus micogutta]GAV21171.1 putative ABC transport system permease protein [Mariprofundus micogutta]
MRILTLASRNVWRNWHRSLVTMLAMAFACFIMIFFASLMEGMIQGSERSVVAMNMGDVQIHAHGYRDDPDLYTRIDHADELVNALEKRGFRAASRIYAYGLLAANMASSGVQLRGVDLKQEEQVTELYRHVSSGKWLDENDALGVVIGKKLAGTLGVELGDELVFVGQSSGGYMANELFRVRGILKSVSDGIDRMGLFMPMDSLRSLMAMPEGVHEIVVIRNDRTTDLAVRTAEVEALSVGLEVKNWKQLMPVIARMVETADVQIMIMLVIFYIAVATVVLNAMLMNVFERIHEFGIMKALGVSPWQLLALVYAETLILTFLAAAVGLAGGWWISDYYRIHGVDLSSMADSIAYGGIAFDPLWYAAITHEALFYPVLFLFIIAAIAVIYPAVKAATLRPVKAIYFR